MSNPIFVLLLTRLQGSQTEKFSHGLLRFICFAAAIRKDGLDPDGVIAMLDGCQPQPGSVIAYFFEVVCVWFDSDFCCRLFAQVLPVLLPDVQKAPTKDRKIIAVGLANFLALSDTMLREPSIRAWYVTYSQIKARRAFS